MVKALPILLSLLPQFHFPPLTQLLTYINYTFTISPLSIPLVLPPFFCRHLLFILHLFFLQWLLLCLPLMQHPRRTFMCISLFTVVLPQVYYFNAKLRRLHLSAISVKNQVVRIQRMRQFFCVFSSQIPRINSNRNLSCLQEYVRVIIFTNSAYPFK